MEKRWSRKKKQLQASGIAAVVWSGWGGGEKHLFTLQFKVDIIHIASHTKRD